MLSEFDIRKKQGNELEDNIDHYLISESIYFIRTGYEYHYDINEVKLIGRAKSTHSIRFLPDRWIPEKDLFLEAISGVVIERKKYDYLINNFPQCYIVNRNFKCCMVEDLKFKIPFAKPYGIEVPIIDRYWRAPNLLPEDLRQLFLQKVREDGKSTSGDMAAFIDWDNILSLDITELI